MASAPLAQAVDAFLLELRVERGLSPLTISAYRRDLAQFGIVAAARWRSDPEPIRDFVIGLQEAGRRGTTQARKVAAIRSFYAFAAREGLVERDLASLVDAPRPGSYLPDVLTPDEVVRILEAPSDEPAAVRDRAILELLYACGLRVSELVGLDTDRIDLERLTVRVIGKGNKERRVPMGEVARRAPASVPGRTSPGMDTREADAGCLRQPAWPAADARIGLEAGTALDPECRGGGARDAAHLPAQLRNPSARGGSRSASGPDPPWPC